MTTNRKMLTDDPIVMRSTLTKAIGVCSETIRLWIKKGKLPEPDIRQSPKITGWKRSTLKAAGIDIG